MNSNDIKNKNLVLCDFIADLTNGKYKVKPEYSTSNKDNEDVIVIQEQSGEKVVFFDNPSLYNYYNVEIFANLNSNELNSLNTVYCGIKE